MTFQKKKVYSYSDDTLDQYQIASGNKGKKGMVFLVAFLVCFGVVLFTWGSLKPYVQQ